MFLYSVVLVFDVVDWYTLVSELKLTALFLTWKIQFEYAIQWVYFSMFCSIFPGWNYLEDVQRFSEILKSLQK